MRETIARVLRSYGLTPRGEVVTAPALAVELPDQNITDADFDTAAWNHGMRSPAAPRRVVLRKLPSDDIGAAPVGEEAVRAVIEPPPQSDARVLQQLHDRGVRGVRFVLDSKTDRDAILRWAERLVPFGWHVEIKLPNDRGAACLADDEWILLQLPIPTCFTGLAGFVAAREADDDAAAFLVELVGMGRFWLKLCGTEIAGADTSARDALHRLVNAAMTVRDDRMVWGSGPSSASTDPQAELETAIQALRQLLPDDASRGRVLWSNPAALYQF